MREKSFTDSFAWQKDKKQTEIEEYFLWYTTAVSYAEKNSSLAQKAFIVSVKHVEHSGLDAVEGMCRFGSNDLVTDTKASLTQIFVWITALCRLNVVFSVFEDTFI